jgi:hypothetical protein
VDEKQIVTSTGGLELDKETLRLTFYSTCERPATLGGYQRQLANRGNVRVKPDEWEVKGSKQRVVGADQNSLADILDG